MWFTKDLAHYRFKKLRNTSKLTKQNHLANHLQTAGNKKNKGKSGAIFQEGKNSEWQVRWESLTQNIRLLNSTTKQGEVKGCGYKIFKRNHQALSKKNKVQVVELRELRTRNGTRDYNN